MLFQKTKITSITGRCGTLKIFPSEHLLFAVEGGAGKLRPVWYDAGEKGASPYDGYCRSALLLGDRPLLQIQGSGCPTCESLLAAGYGLPEESEVVQRMRKVLNEPYTGLEDALERLNPLLALLPSSCFILTYSQSFPTDGDGHFFWNVPEKLTSYRATADYYDTESYSVFPSFPCFFYPTQGAQQYDAKRVAHYRDLLRSGKALPPVLVYSLESYMSALLDGHHRACACALEGVPVPCLTIARPCRYWMEGVPHLLWPDGGKTALSTTLTPRQTELLDCWKGERRQDDPFTDDTIAFGRQWEAEYEAAAGRYPNCFDVGVLALYPEAELNAAGIRALAMDDDLEEVVAAAHLLHFAARQQGADKKGLALPFLEKGCPSLLRKTAYEVLDSVKDDPEVDDIMIDVLVHCERKDDPIYQIANGHWDM